jgi:ATP-dependent Lhr-like helicase
VKPEGTVVVSAEGGMAWWTFAGDKANAALAPALAKLAQVQTVGDTLAIQFERTLPIDEVQQAIEELRYCDRDTLLPEVNPEALEGMKFSDCLPPGLGVHVLGARTQDLVALEHVLRAPTRWVSS